MDAPLALGSLERFGAEAAKVETLLKSLANANRLLVLCHLVEEGELSVGALQGRVGLGQSALSQHLARLRDEGLVTTRKEAQTIYYEVADPRARQVLALLHELFCPDLAYGEKEGAADA